MTIHSSTALVIYAAMMAAAFMFSTFYEQAPFLAFASQFTIGFVAYVTKRLMQRKAIYNNHKEE